MTCLLCHSQNITTEKIDTKRLVKLYYSSLKVDVSHILKQDILYHHCQECDLKFFTHQDGSSPAGDNAFYNFLNKIPWYYFSEKTEYEYAKHYIQANDRVLEVGCGKGAFAKYLPTSNYVGLELSTDAKKMAQENGINIKNQSIQDYSNSNPESTDVVCSFQVLEHVSNPYDFLSSQLMALRGGGH